MSKKPSPRYWIDDPSTTWTRSQVRKLSKQKRIDIATAWFLRNYEDPANETPYETREGGYQYIWGGPYDAADEISNEFGSLLSDDDIDAAVQKVQEDGIYDWAPTRTTNDTDDEFDSSDAIIGSPLEMERRQAALVALRDLIDAVPTFNSDTPGLGHNNPPEPILASNNINIHIGELHIHATNLTSELATELPSVETVETEAGFFKRSLDKLLELTNKAISNKISAGIGAAAVYIGDKTGIIPMLTEKALAAWTAIQGWLHLFDNPF
jgi:hypothetical protein